MNLLLLVPTRREIDALALPPEILFRTKLCGFGPVASAARAAELLARHRPDVVVLAGIAGAYDENLSLGSAVWCGEWTLDGVGAGEGESFLSADAMGFGAVEDLHEGPLPWTLPATDESLHFGRDVMCANSLTVCAASGDADHAARRRTSYPSVAIEEMEGFGVALAARLAGVRAGMMRGISNRAGDRNVGGWRIDEALAAVRSEIVSTFAANG